MHRTALEHGDERIALPVDVVSEHAGGGHGEDGALGCRVGIIEGDRRRVGRRVIATVKAALARWNSPLDTVIVKLNSPSAVGVPDRTPASLRVSPGGRPPVVTAKLPGGLPVAEVNVWL